MGAWSFGSFDNDSALDWFAGGEIDSLEVASVLRQVAEAGDSLVSTNLACAALAAAEFVAAAGGKGDERLDEVVSPWLVRHRAEVAAIEVSLARRAVQRVFENSELRELFSDYAEWHADVRELLEVESACVTFTASTCFFCASFGAE